MAGVFFSADGQTLVAANYDSTIRMWDTDPARAAEQVCAVTRGSLTEAIWQQYADGLPYQPVCPGQAGAADAAAAGPVATARPGPVAAPVPCVAADLTIAYGQFSPPDTSGLGAVRLLMTNHSNRACTLNSDPAISLIGPPDRDGETSYELRRYDHQPSPLLVQPGAAAHVDVHFGQSDGDSAWTPTTIALTLPFAGGTLNLPWSSGPVVPNTQASRPFTYVGIFVAGP